MGDDRGSRPGGTCTGTVDWSDAGVYSWKLLRIGGIPGQIVQLVRGKAWLVAPGT